MRGCCENAPTRRRSWHRREVIIRRLPRDTLPPDEADKYEMACRGLVAEFAAVKLLPVRAIEPCHGNMYKGACTMKCPCTVVVPTVCAKYLSRQFRRANYPTSRCTPKRLKSREPIRQRYGSSSAPTISVSRIHGDLRDQVSTTRVADTHYASTPLAWWLLCGGLGSDLIVARSPRRPSPRPTPSGRSRTASKRSRARRPPWE